MDFPIHGAKHGRSQWSANNQISEIQFGLCPRIRHADIVLRAVKDTLASLLSWDGPKIVFLPDGKVVGKKQKKGGYEVTGFHI